MAMGACFTSIKAKLARRAAGGVWDSSKGRIFRIKTLCLVPLPDSWSAMQRPNGIYSLLFQQAAGRGPLPP